MKLTIFAASRERIRTAPKLIGQFRSASLLRTFQRRFKLLTTSVGTSVDAEDPLRRRHAQ